MSASKMYEEATKVSEERKQVYLSNPQYCIVCQQKTLQASELVFNQRANTACCKINCTNCGAIWGETWVLSSINSISLPPKQSAPIETTDNTSKEGQST